MRTQTHPAIAIDLVGQLDSDLSSSLASTLTRFAAGTTFIVSLERIESTQWAGLCDLADVIVKARAAGLAVYAHARLKRVRSILAEFNVPFDVPQPGSLTISRRVIIARTPQARVA